MSTKIYNAYKVISKNPWETIWDIQEKSKLVINSNIKSILGGISKEEISKIELMTRKDYESPYWGEYDPECNIGVSPLGKDVYFITYGDRSNWTRGCFKHLEKNKDIVDFSYQNQTDELPEGVTRTQYNKRIKVWEKLFKKDFTLKHVVLEILTFKQVMLECNRFKYYAKE